MIEIGSDHLAQLLNNPGQRSIPATPPPLPMCPESSWPSSNLWGRTEGAEYQSPTWSRSRGGGWRYSEPPPPKPTSAHWGLVWAQQELSLTGDTAVGDGVGWGREWWMGVWGRWEEPPGTGKSSLDTSLAFSGNNLLLFFLSWFYVSVISCLLAGNRVPAVDHWFPPDKTFIRYTCPKMHTPLLCVSVCTWTPSTIRWGLNR